MPPVLCSKSVGVAAAPAKQMHALSLRKARADPHCLRHGQDLLQALREQIAEGHVTFVIQTAWNHCAVTQHRRLIAQCAAVTRLAPVARRPLRSVKALTVLHEHALRCTPAPCVPLPRVREDPVQRQQDLFIPAVQTALLRAVQIPQAVVDQHAAL